MNPQHLSPTALETPHTQVEDNDNRCMMHTQGNKAKVKFSLEHAAKAQRGSTGIALLFL